jgi:probable HAF family extracellular repeat protein
LNRRIVKSIAAVAALAMLVLPVPVTAQVHPAALPRYKLIDLGTLGGFNAYINAPERTINKSGVVAASADTTTKDTFPASCQNPDCYVSHTYFSQHGVATGVGALPGTNSSQPAGINDKGVMVGQSQNGKIDPITHQPDAVGVSWPRGRIRKLSSLGGTSSFGLDINNSGEIAGWALNKIPYTMSPWGNLGTEQRAVIWRHGKIHDLGTLGGPAAYAYLINGRGQVTGQAYTNSNVNPITGTPTAAPFLWQSGERMINLGSLGGTNGGASALNDSGQVAGTSNLRGDSTYHPFLWSKGKLTDLGTLGGHNASTGWMNNAGHVVGVADLPGSKAHHAFLWSHETMTDLGTVSGDTCSSANGINTMGQVVGASGICHVAALHGFLWERGQMIDLNTLIARPSSGLVVTDAAVINNRGDIAARALLPNGNTHIVLLVPRK